MPDYRTPRALLLVTGLEWSRKRGEYEYRLPASDVDALQEKLAGLGIVSGVLPGHENNPRQTVTISAEEAAKALPLAEAKGGIGYHGVRKTAQHHDKG